MVHLSSLFSAAAAAALPLVFALPHDSHDHSVQKRVLPSDTWLHPAHPAHQLFRRDGQATSNASLPTVGSPTWSAAYPTGTPDTSQLPAAWTNALNSAVAAGKIPNIPASTNNPQDLPTYPTGYDPTSQEVCSGTYKCQIPGDIWNGTEGTFGCGFDDGPLPPSTALYAFLKENNQRATHFMIGLNILWNPEIFLNAFNNGDDIALHTYTHPYMTTLSNLQLLAEFGWAMQIIHDSTGGRLPRFWRPPYGDTDIRVRAIAKEIFGLTTIVWNQDTEDWSIPSGGTTVTAVEQNLKTWLEGPKSPGLIILEHELFNQTVDCFMEAYPLIAQNGWNAISTAEMAAAQLGVDGVYMNSDDDSSALTETNNVLAGGAASNASSIIDPPSSATSTATSESSTSSSSAAAPDDDGSSGRAAATGSSQPQSEQSSATALQPASLVILALSIAFTAVLA